MSNFALVFFNMWPFDPASTNPGGVYRSVFDAFRHFAAAERIDFYDISDPLDSSGMSYNQMPWLRIGSFPCVLLVQGCCVIAVHYYGLPSVPHLAEPLRKAQAGEPVPPLQYPRVDFPADWRDRLAPCLLPSQ
jgi:hypothetical protein